ncbi:hypothetical protein AAFF_G00040640 [Aldrovandia affinis]|uniref:Uncharacterized protein n=1 Tax=Aldrovandia affinis TaxID=143900 RepID=A0AAD7S525_9TELE|nr:hypothetical protein AAFF_G00040640 [Aldrovandia affinis]
MEMILQNHRKKARKQKEARKPQNRKNTTEETGVAVPALSCKCSGTFCMLSMMSVWFSLVQRHAPSYKKHLRTQTQAHTQYCI